MMKRLFFIYIFSLFCLPFSYGQRTQPRNLPTYDNTPIHFGFSLAVNQTNFNVTKNQAFNQQDSLLAITLIPRTGFDLHIIANMRLGEYVDLRFLPGLTFAQRDLNFQYRKDLEGTKFISLKQLQSTYLDFPLELKFKSTRINNYRVYTLAGVQYMFDLESKENSTDPTIIKLKQNDFYYSAGVGIDFYMAFFKFSVELKSSWGMNDVLHNRDLTSTRYIDNLQAQRFLLSFHFE